ncbi:hypothetical protein [Secundilactobacillus silagei]|uniref:DUF4064 domain-containing protein n=1 Tax=Secundilactobacillus silagei JCM 19001 TaxID=1302250 RepID=A0A1Z5H431_9LACO|nr:hypothetical protein [Secundilactobacillus silagei]TDG70297.1 hypothetical protein C5L25_001487 [Secundilactobacillus silagei JCM 19001]GAT17931.1 hypothetical protein IWT126_00188 [Secundilactobacillus silagei JCM 19001]
MAKKIQGADGKMYKQVSTSSNAGEGRKRTLEVVLGVISLVLSIVSLASGFGVAAVADSFGGGGSYTMELFFGILLSIAAFILIFFLNKKHTLISIAIIVLGIVLLFSCGNFGVLGGIFFTITGIIALFRK